MIVLAILTVFALLPLEVIHYRDKSIVCILSFLVNGFFFLGGMLSAQRKHPISMRIVYWIFMFFFMYFAPLIQFLKSKYPWRGSLTEAEILSTNMTIFFFNIVFIIGSYLPTKVRVKGFTNLNLSKFMCSDFFFC